MKPHIYPKVSAQRTIDYPTIFITRRPDTRVYRDANDLLHRDHDLPAVIMDNGDRYWYKHGVKHRDGDKPAVIRANGHREWWIDGVIHRSDDKPATITSNGDQFWYINGKLGRKNDLPSAILDDGGQVWHFEGEFHRDNDQPAIQYPDGTRHWYNHGVLHRDGGPASITVDDNGGTILFFYNDGKLHRPLNKGPAVQSMISVENEYWVEGKRIPNWRVKLYKFFND